MADKRGTKRPTKEERRDRLAKMVNLGKGKAKVGAPILPKRVTPPPDIPIARVAAPAAQVTAPVVLQAVQASRPTSHPREDR